MMNVRFLLAAAILPTLAVGAAEAQRSSSGHVLRIPLQPMSALPMPRPMRRWKESRGPRCIARAQIAAAKISGPGKVDFILRDRTLIRARLRNSCPALDYYSGFYLQRTADDNICRDRDAVHARSGGECQIDAFRKLTPRP